MVVDPSSICMVIYQITAIPVPTDERAEALGAGLGEAGW